MPQEYEGQVKEQFAGHAYRSRSSALRRSASCRFGGPSAFYPYRGVRTEEYLCRTKAKGLISFHEAWTAQVTTLAAYSMHNDEAFAEHKERAAEGTGQITQRQIRFHEARRAHATTLASYSMSNDGAFARRQEKAAMDRLSHPGGLHACTRVSDDHDMLMTHISGFRGGCSMQKRRAENQGPFRPHTHL